MSVEAGVLSARRRVAGAKAKRAQEPKASLPGHACGFAPGHPDFAFLTVNIGTVSCVEDVVNNKQRLQETDPVIPTSATTTALHFGKIAACVRR
jgi:hypothetical protein